MTDRRRTMLYFRKVTLNEVNGTKVEAAIRKFTARRHTSLDLQSSSTDIWTEKLFLGLENENSIQVTRIRTSFERLLPKLIVRFDKERGFSEYRIRYSLISNSVFAFITLAIVLNVVYSLINLQIEGDISTIFTFFILFLFLTVVELRLTNARLIKAIVKMKEPSSSI